MNNINDELLNRYIDNELDNVELSELKAALDNDAEAVARLKALRTVDNSLKQMQNETAPAGLTEKLMIKIQSATKIVKPKISYFFVSVLSIFSIAILAIVIYALRTVKINNSKSALDPIFEQIQVFASKNLSFFDLMFKNNAILLIGTMLAVVMLFTAYFTFESHKNFRNKLNSISH